MDSDFHTLKDLGTGRGKGLGCLSYGRGRREAEGLYVGHLSAGEKGGGLWVGTGEEAVGDAQQQQAGFPLVSGIPPVDVDGCGWS